MSSQQGQTPLEIAVKSNKLEVVQLFMKLGAEPTLQDWVRYYPRYYNFFSCINILVDGNAH